MTETECEPSLSSTYPGRRRPGPIVRLLTVVVGSTHTVFVTFHDNLVLLIVVLLIIVQVLRLFFLFGQ